MHKHSGLSKAGLAMIFSTGETRFIFSMASTTVQCKRRATHKKNASINQQAIDL
ncbi:hypothetical protein [Iodobacter sp. BJB302]|uniref:hypothetical protein n=1 Tax=Iodobacter sp. BJB302 TaxID=1506510 RepID=UPI0015D4768F|nr:hypothetical protein [Iodobacter sp. BJB302]